MSQAGFIDPYPDRTPDEVHGLTMDFATDDAVANGALVVSATVSAEAHIGCDPDASSILQGASALVGTVVKQFVTGGVVGVTYAIVFKAVLSNDETIEAIGYQTVVSA